MRRRLKRSTRKGVIIITLCTTLVVGIFVILYFTLINDVKVNYQKEIELLTEQLDSKKVYVFEAKESITAGKEITKDKLEYVEAYSNQPQDFYLTDKEIGNLALIDINKGTQILKSMTKKEMVDNTLREVEYNTFLLNNNSIINDIVDIRINYSNGEDYIVLSKKTLNNIVADTGNIYMWLNPEEILCMSSAIVDCYINEGSRLYTVKYIEPLIQEASQVTYIPNQAVLGLIQEDPNVVQTALDELSKGIRGALESRLSEFYMNNSGDINWNDSQTYYQNSSGNKDSDNLIDNSLNSDQLESEEEVHYVE